LSYKLDFMTLLCASLVAVLVAPFVIGGLRRVPGGPGFFDGFVVISIGGLVLLHILPHALLEGGALAAGGVFLGVLLPLLTEELWDRGAGRRGRNLTLLAGLLGLALHALFDGVALTAGGHEHAHAHEQLLALAVVLHRLPVGIAIWWVVTPIFGRRVGAAALFVIVGATVAGYFGAGAIRPTLEGAGWAALQAFVAGALLHVAVGHHEHREPGGSKGRLASVVGGAVASVGLWALSTAHPVHQVAGALDAAASLLTLGMQCAAPVLLGLFVVGVVRILLPRGPVGGRTPWGQALCGAALGPLLCPCSCAVRPVHRSLAAEGPAASALLVSAPEVGVATVLLSLRLLGVELGLLHVLFAGLIGVGVGTCVGARQRAARLPTAAPRPVEARVRDGLRHAFGEIADHTLPWILFGLGIAALAEPLLDPAHLRSITPGAQIALAVALGTPLHVCAAGAMPLCVVLVHKGLVPGAASAFLVAGPASMAGIGRRARLVTRSAMAGGALVSGYLVNLVLPSAPGSMVPLHQLAAASQGHAWLVWPCLCALGLLMLRSLLRQGVPGFLGQVLSLHGRDHAAHRHQDARRSE
jgi:hypothetical protein